MILCLASHVHDFHCSMNGPNIFSLIRCKTRIKCQWHKMIATKRTLQSCMVLLTKFLALELWIGLPVRCIHLHKAYLLCGKQCRNSPNPLWVGLWCWENQVDNQHINLNHHAQPWRTFKCVYYLSHVTKYDNTLQRVLSRIWGCLKRELLTPHANR